MVAYNKARKLAQPPKGTTPRRQYGVAYCLTTATVVDSLRQCEKDYAYPQNLNLKSDYILTIFLTVLAVLIVSFVLIFALAVLDHQFVF